MKSNEIEKSELENLARSLKGLNRPDLNWVAKKSLKNRIFMKLDIPLVELVKSDAQEVYLSEEKKASIKQRIFAVIEGGMQENFFTSLWKSFTSTFFGFQKKFVGVMLLFAMGFYMFAFLNVDTNVVFASTFTTLDSFDGEVFLQREGEFIDVFEGMRIYEKDRLITGADGYLSVKFFDDSVSRLSSDSELVVQKLFRPSQSAVKSYVEVSLVSGEVWSRVVNLVEDQSSFVVEVQDAYAAAKKAAFNVQIVDEGAKVDVFKNVVDVRVDEDSKVVVSGQKALLTGDNKVEVQDIDDADRDSDWVKSNLDSDKVYLTQVEERLLAAKMESAGVEAEDDFKAGNSVKEKTLLFLTFDDVKKKKIGLDLAEKAFIAAEVRLRDEGLTEEELGEIDEALEAFDSSVKDFYEFIAEVETTDEKYADELEAYVEEKILLQKKSLSLVLPGSLSYEAKEIVNDLELLTAHGETETIKLKADQGLSKLSEAEDVLENGDYELANQIVDEYIEGVDEVVTNINKLEENEAPVRDDLISGVESGVKLLGSIDKSVAADNGKNLSVSVPEAIVDKPDTSNETGADSIAVVEDENVGEKEDEVEEEVYKSGDYGVKIQGDKPLPPLLNF